MFSMAEAYAATHHQGAVEVLKELLWNLWLYNVYYLLVCVTLNVNRTCSCRSVTS